MQPGKAARQAQPDIKPAKGIHFFHLPELPFGRCRRGRPVKNVVGMGMQGKLLFDTIKSIRNTFYKQLMQKVQTQHNLITEFHLFYFLFC